MSYCSCLNCEERLNVKNNISICSAPQRLAKDKESGLQRENWGVFELYFEDAWFSPHKHCDWFVPNEVAKRIISGASLEDLRLK
jgi:hypothetical protein